MCILFVHVNPEPKKNEYRLIIATNRDEVYQRPAKTLYRCEKTGVVGGRDWEPGREGGMWLGMKENDMDNSSKMYSVGVLLNITGAKAEKPQGRGVLVENYLSENWLAEDYVRKLQDENKEYNGFNLVTIELSKDNVATYSYSNAPNSVNVYRGKQTLAFGNSPVTNPLQKVQAGQAIFQDIIQKELSGEKLIEELLNLLKREHSYLPDEELQKRAPEAYEFLSSIYVKIEPAGYGTRTHSIILVNYNWSCEFFEYTLEENTDVNNPKWHNSLVSFKPISRI